MAGPGVELGGEAAGHVGPGLGFAVGGPLFLQGIRWAISADGAPLLQVLVVDTSAAAWNLYGTRLLDLIPPRVIKSPEFQIPLPF